MANYSIVVSEAQTVVDDMDAANSQLQTSLDNLIQAINAFTTANNGHAPDAYATAQADWNSGQSEMTQSLATGKVRLAEIIAAYIHGDKQGAGLFL
jgi:uncharacterized protein YukE